MIANKNAPEESEALLGYFGQTEITHFIRGREHEKVTFRFMMRNASFYFLGTFRFADYMSPAGRGTGLFFFVIVTFMLERILPFT